MIICANFYNLKLSFVLTKVYSTSILDAFCSLVLVTVVTQKVHCFIVAEIAQLGERQTEDLKVPFNANISFTFQAFKNLYAHPTYLWFRLFGNCLGDF